MARLESVHGLHGVRAMESGGALPPIIYLLRDQFTTNEAAPLTSPRTCEPGPGTVTVVDTENKLSIAGSVLTCAGGKAVPAYGDPGIVGPSYARVPGRAFILRFTPHTNNLQIGWSTALGLIDQNGLALTGHFTVYEGGWGVDTAVDTPDTTYILAFVLRASGCYYAAKGGEMADWTLLNASANKNAANVKPCISNFNAVWTADNFRVVDLPEPFKSDAGVVSGANFTAAAVATLNRANP